MTVSELIENLKQFDQNLEVLFEDDRDLCIVTGFILRGENFHGTNPPYHAIVLDGELV